MLYVPLFMANRCYSHAHLLPAPCWLPLADEAYVIYSFTYFMMYYVAKGDETKFLAEFAQRDRHHGAHLPPVKWVLAQWELGQEFWDKCKVRGWCVCGSVWQCVAVCVAVCVCLRVWLFAQEELHCRLFTLGCVPTCSYRWVCCNTSSFGWRAHC